MTIASPNAGMAAAILHAFGRGRISCPNETALQDLVEEKLKGLGLDYIREARLGPKNRPDFLTGNIAIEVKFNHSQSTVLRQLKRYADEPTIQGIILIALKSYNIPPTLSNKPIHVITLWKNIL